MDPFRRVRPGEAVRISATAWNALMDMVRPTRGESASTVEQSRLPAQVACLAGYTAGIRRPLIGEAVQLVALSGDDGAAATVPLVAGLTLSAVERRLGAGYRVKFRLLDPQTAGAAADDPVAICTDPERLMFAVAGLAWVRVRSLRPWHRFARRCLPHPGDGLVELADSVGCLDSCGWGPVAILGWARAEFDPQAPYEQLSPVPGEPGIYWALVRM